MQNTQSQLIRNDEEMVRVVIRMLCGRVTVDRLSQEYEIDPAELRQWIDAFIIGGQKALKEISK